MSVSGNNQGFAVQKQKISRRGSARYKHWTSRESHSLIQIWAMPAIQIPLQRCAQTYQVWMKVARLCSAAHPEAPKRTWEQCRDRVDYMKKLHRQAKGLNSHRTMKTSPFFPEIERVLAEYPESAQKTRLIKSRTCSSDRRSSASPDQDWHVSQDRPAPKVRLDPQYARQTRYKKKKAQQSGCISSNWTSEEVFSLVQIWSMPHIQSALKTGNKCIWARITRSLNLMHSKNTKEVNQVKEQMEHLKALYRRAKQERSRNSPFYKPLDAVLGKTLMPSSAPASTSTVDTEELWSLLQAWSTEEVHMTLSSATDRDTYDLIWKRIGQKLFGHQPMQPHMESELGEIYERRLKQMMRTLYQNNDEVHLGGIDTAAFYKQVDHIIKSVLTHHHCLKTNALDHVRCMYCAQVTFDISNPRRVLSHLANCSTASFGVRCQFNLEELAVSTVLSIEPLSPSDTPVLIADSPDTQLVAQDGNGEVFDSFPRVQSPGIIIVNPRSERNPDTNTMDNRISSPSVDMRAISPLVSNMIMSDEDIEGQWFEETDIKPPHTKDSGLGLSASSSSAGFNTESSDGYLLTGDSLDGMDAAGGATMSPRPMTVVTVKEEPIDEPTQEPTHEAIDEAMSSSNGHGASSQEAGVTQPINDQDIANQALAKALCATGVSFDVILNKYWGEFMKTVSPHYITPSPNILINHLVTEEFTKVEQSVQGRLADITSLALYVSGWKDPGQGMVQYVVLTPEPVFFAAHKKGDVTVDVAEKEKDLSSVDFHDKVVNHVVDVIDKIGPSKVAVLIMDIKLNKDLPYGHILKARCPIVALTDVLSKAVSQFPSVENMIKEAKEACREILMGAAGSVGVDVFIFDKVQNFKEKHEVDICTFIDQLFALNKYLPRLQLRIEKLDGEVSHQVEILRTINSRVGEFREEAVMILEEVFDVLRKLTDAESPPLLYDVKPLMDDLVQRISKHEFPDETFNNFKETLTSGILSCIDPVHCAAYMLRPLDIHTPMVTKDIIKANQVVTRLATHLDLEVGRVIASLAEFRAHQGIWRDPSVWMSTKYISPLTWWQGLCSSEPISSVACRLMDLPMTLSPRKLIPKFSNHLVQYGDLPEDNISRLAFIRGNLHLSQLDGH